MGGRSKGGSEEGSGKRENLNFVNKIFDNELQGTNEELLII